MYRDETAGAGGGRLTKEAYDRAMLLNKGPLIGGHHSTDVPLTARRTAAGRPAQRAR